VAITGSTSNGETGSLNAAGTHTVGVGTASGSAAATNGGQSCAAALGGGAANCFGVSEVCLVSVTVSTGGVTISTNAHEVWKNSGSLALNCGAMPDPTKTVAGGGPVITDPCNDPSWAGLANDFSGPPPSGCFPSPIVIDTEGEGFHLTSAADGVTFDIRGDGHPIQIAWTAAGSHNAFLALDRNGDGKITSGKELFGNFTQQPVSAKPNGFLALEEFDQPENGGNGDGIIDERDTVFSQLVLWIDDNHDGVVQPSELHKLSEFGIRSLTLRYFESRRTDEFGNQFRYRARINPDRNHRDRRDETKSGEPARWAYDVFFVTQ